MNYIKRNPIELTASNTEVNDFQVWQAGTYDEGTQVSYKNKNWVALQQTTVEPSTDPLHWKDEGAINRYKPFDIFINTQAEMPEVLQYTFTAGASDILAFFNIEGTSIEITHLDAIDDTVISVKTLDLVTSDIQDWGDYFFGDIEYKDRLFVRFPLIFFSKFTVKVFNTGSTAKLGVIAAGRESDLGVTLATPSVGINDYSKKQTNADGYTYLAVGNYSDRISLEIIFDTQHFDLIKRRLTRLRGKDVVYLADEREEGFESLILYGFFEDFSQNFSNATTSNYTIELKGLI